MRFKSITIENFKNVEHGFLSFDNPRRPDGPSILALYGQNGSGKSALINCIDIFKHVIGGGLIPQEYAYYIRWGSDHATITYELEENYGQGGISSISYILEFEKDITQSLNQDDIFDAKPCHPVICSETLMYRGLNDKRKHVLFTTKDTDLFGPKQLQKRLSPFCRKINTPLGKAAVEQPENLLSITPESIKSFYASGMSIMHIASAAHAIVEKAFTRDEYTIYQIDSELNPDDEKHGLFYSVYKRMVDYTNNLYIARTGDVEAIEKGVLPFFYESQAGRNRNERIALGLALNCIEPEKRILIRPDSKKAGRAEDNAKDDPFTILKKFCKKIGYSNNEMSIFIEQAACLKEAGEKNGMDLLRGNDIIPLSTDDRHVMPIYPYRLEDTKQSVQKISRLLEVIVPGLSLELVITGEYKHCQHGYLSAKRAHSSLPLACESRGIQKIVSVAVLLYNVYNNSSFTAVVDELDAGIFEFLLGEILEVISQEGEGQLIFTSHNLRPLEVLDRGYIAFSTTNPKNRYIRLKNVKTTNNLRDFYYRSIIFGGQDERVYERTTKGELSLAFMALTDDESGAQPK